MTERTKTIVDAYTYEPGSADFFARCLEDTLREDIWDEVDALLGRHADDCPGSALALEQLAPKLRALILDEPIKET